MINVAIIVLKINFPSYSSLEDLEPIDMSQGYAYCWDHYEMIWGFVFGNSSNMICPYV